MTKAPKSEPISPSADKVISITEAAELAGVSPDTLKRCHERGELKIIKISPRRRGIRLSNLQSFLETREAL